MNGKPDIRGYIAPALLWAGAMVAFPLLRFLPDSWGLPALLACMFSHPLGGCWMLYRLRGRRDLLGWRIVICLPATTLFALSLLEMRSDDLLYGAVMISGVMAVAMWLVFAAMWLPRPAD